MTHPKYDVFLSFRGEDTRDNFTSHLHAELCRQHIETFIDNRLVRGEEISPALCKAIEESAIYVIILSQHYASSSWCLDELTKILECKERYGREVIPVFYNVDPSNVRHQRNSYADDFVKHHLRFGDKVDAWKAALTQVANLSGWDSQKTRPDSKLVEEIVKDILKKSSSCVSDDHEGKIAIDKHIEQIQTLLHLESSTVRVIGMWGMGGIGKTEIAGAIYEKLATHFSSRGIVKNVQQEIKLYGVDHVKRKHLSHLLDQQDITSSKSNFSFDPRLKRINVLLVFDDVKDSDQLNDLIGSHTNFGNGSRIIVTSRDKQVLKNVNVDEIYHVVEMDDKDSLQLFCLNAFKQKEPIETYVSLTKKVLNYAKGVPLVLKVLGLFLQGRAKEAWESELQKLEKNPEPKIFNALKLSYDGLDDIQKYIFLDIACFGRGETEKSVVQTLDCYGFSTRIEMDVLKERCLISTLEGRVWMHDRIQEMGHEIVRQESFNNPEKRSRLHKPDDIYDVLKKNKGHGSDAIQSILINLDEIKKVQLHAETFKKMHNLRMIRFYNCYSMFTSDLNVTFRTVLCSFPDNLKFLGWDKFPQRFLPQDFCPDNLVALDMPFSRLERLWETDKTFPNLKRLDLSRSKKMIGVPDLSLFPNIEEIILSDCVSLEKVYSSSFLHKLNWLRLDGCTSLKSLSVRSNILSRSTGLVTLRGCCNLETISITSTTDVIDMVTMSKFEGGYMIRHPYFSWDIENLKFKTVLRLDHCLKLEELPSSLHHLVGLEELSLRGCKKLKTIPSSIGNLSKLLKLDLINCESLETFPSSIFKLKLTELNFYGCSMLRTFPEIPCDIGRLSCLTKILLRGTNIVNLPDSMVHLSSLKSLDLRDCKSLECIPKDIGRLSSLTEILLRGTNIVNLPESMVHFSSLKLLDLSDCKSLECIPKDIGRLSSLTKISLQGSKIVNLPESMVLLSSLKSLDLRDCKSLECIPKDIGRLSSLTEILLRGTNIVNLPESMVHLSSLKLLDLRDCKSLECIPKDIGRLSSLTKIPLQGSKIVNLPESMVHLSSLKSLYLRDCKSLECIPKDIGRLSSLTEILLRGTNIVNLPESMVHLSSLESLDLSNCKSLECIPKDIGLLSSLTEILLRGSNIVNIPESMVHLSSLKSLDLSDCKRLECIPKLPPCLGKLLAFDCTSIKKVVPNPSLKLMSDSHDEMDGLCQFYLTNSEELEASSWSYIVNEALIKITDTAYESAVFCFPGSRVPDWFIHRCQGHSITVNNGFGYLCSENRLIGFALCIVFRDEDMDGTRIRVSSSIAYRLSFISDGDSYSFHNHLYWNYEDRSFIQDHTFIWSYRFDLARISNSFLDAYKINFEILGKDSRNYQLNVKVKECGLRPLYNTKERNASQAAQ